MVMPTDVAGSVFRGCVFEEIHRLVEESAITRERGNLREALEKGKEAGKKDCWWSVVVGRR